MSACNCKDAPCFSLPCKSRPPAAPKPPRLFDIAYNEYTVNPIFARR